MTPLQTVRTFIAALERKDFDSAEALLAPDCEYDNVPMSKMFGPAVIRAAMEGFLAQCTAIDWVVMREAETGNIVCNERIDRFEMPHGWIELPVAGIWEVVDSKITLWRDYFDLGSFQRAMAPAADV